MIKVLIAEDELPLLRGIQKMIEGLDPEFHVVKGARNGREALDYLQNRPVDVVFTDINMPLVDGIQILKYAAEMSPAVPAVVISGYRDFAYARKALLYQARNYLLKPVDREELAELLGRLKEELKIKEGKEKNRVLTGILYEGNPAEVEKGLFETVFPVYLTAGAFNPNNLEEAAPGNRYWKRNDLKSIAAAVTGQEKGVFCFYGKAMNEQILLLEETEKMNMAAVTEELVARLDPGLPVTACYGEAVADIGRVKEVLSGLRKEIRRRGIFGETAVVNHLPEQEEFILSQSTETAISHAIKKENFSELEGILLNIRDQMKHQRITQSDLERFLKKLFLMVAACQESGLYLDITEFLAYAPDLDQVFEEFILYTKDMKKDGNAEDKRELMRQVDEYILSHMKTQLTTKMLASRFGLVSPYLSKLFKEYKGLTPSQYIQDMRLNSAKELLVTYPELMSKDIAEMVGYHDPLYFSKTFKKNVGVYPSEYRAEHLEQ